MLFKSFIYNFKDTRKTRDVSSLENKSNESVVCCSNQSYIEYMWLMKKNWMNIRRPLIKHYQILDQEYNEDMRKLEDMDKSLNENFTIQGYLSSYINYLVDAKERMSMMAIMTNE